MSEMEERLAEAMWWSRAKLAGCSRDDWAIAAERPLHEGQEYWRALARVALASIRVPTDGMVDAGSAGILSYNDHDALNGWYSSTLKCWQAMIDEALR